MRRIIFLALAVALMGAACNRQETPNVDPSYSDGTILIAGRSISYELAAGPIKKQKGLSGRASIEENQGMLFQFDIPDFPTFWMKDMNFTIDIIWLRGNEVIDISTEAQAEPGVPDPLLKTYKSASPSDRVLELKAGWAARNSLKIGDKVEILQLVQ